MMERAREEWGGAWSDGKGAGGMGRCMGRWEGRGSDRVVYVGQRQETLHYTYINLCLRNFNSVENRT